MATRRDAVEARHLGGDRLAIRVRGHELFADQPVGQERYAAAWRRELASLPPEDVPLTAGVLDRPPLVAGEEQFELGLKALATGMAGMAVQGSG